MTTYSRSFNTSGPNIIAQHYTLMRPKLVAKGLDMVRKDRYFTIWAPRQTGKSTYFRLLATELEKEDFKVCHVNIEAFSAVDEAFLCHHLSKRMSNVYKYEIKGETIDWLFENLMAIPNEKFVFIVDEIEGLNPEMLNRFLHTIRSCYHSRNQHSLKSVILVGVANITGVIQHNASPFNTNDNLEIPYFTKTEIYELFGQHEAESGQVFLPEVKEKICEITAGQPGLVNGFGLQFEEKYAEKPVIEYADYLAVEHWYLHESLDKNVANIVNKAKQHQLFVEKLLFTESQIPFTVYNEQIRYLHIQGVLKKNAEGNVEFWVPLYKKCLQQYIYPKMNGESEEIQRNIDIEEYFTETGMLNWDKMIRGYQEYVLLRGFRYFMQKNEKGEPKNLLEAALMYSFETYIQSFLQVMKGKSYLEAHVGLGISDLLVNIQGNQAVIEGKIYTNITQFRDGKAQLAYYAKRMGLTKGIYLVFVDSKVTHPKVLEAVEVLDSVELTTYLVRYDVSKDFTEPRKMNS